MKTSQKSGIQFDICTLYVDNGGSDLSRCLLVARLLEYFGDNLVALSYPGIATILAFRSGAAKALRIIPDEDDDDIDIAVAKLKKICQEVDCIRIDKNSYKSRLDYNDTSELVSNTLLNLLSSLSPKLDHTLPAMLIGNISTSVLKNHPTQLQISLAVLLRDSKELVKAMNDFGVTGLVQIVVDNFDAEISS